VISRNSIVQLVEGASGALTNRSLASGEAQSTNDLAASGPKGGDYPELLFLVAFAAFALATWFAFTLAEVGHDRPTIVLALGVAALVGGGTWALRRRRRFPGVGDVVGVLVPLVAAVALFFPPDEWILGGLDPGGYVNGGASIARTGGIVDREAALSSLPNQIEQTLFILDGNRLPGFYVVREDFSGFIPTGYTITQDLVVPHGFHLYPTALAFGYALGGIRSELFVTPLLAVSAVVGFFFLVRSLFGVTIAALSSLLLATSPAEVWFARYPAAEIMTQLLLFGSLLAFVRMVVAPGPRVALLAGFALGLVHLTKIELLPIPFLFGTFFCVQALAGRFDRRWLWCIGAYLGVLAQAIWHARNFASWYTVITVRESVSTGVAVAAGFASIGLLGFTSVVLVSPWARRKVSEAVTHPRTNAVLSMALPVTLIALALYYYFIRPLGAEAGPANQLAAANAAIVNNRESFVRLGWFVTQAGLALGVIGWAIILRQHRNRAMLLPMLLIAADAYFFLSDPKITPVYYWAARRWVTLIIPAVCLGIAVSICALAPRARREWGRALLTITCVGVLVYQLIPVLNPLVGYVEYEGAITEIGALAQSFPANAVVLFANDDAGIRFSVPMEYLFQRTSILVPADPQVEKAVVAAAELWSRQGRPVYWVAVHKSGQLAALGLSGALIQSTLIDVPEKIATSDRPPGADGEFQVRIDVWKLDPSIRLAQERTGRLS
jgi:hypothetical protein